MNYKGDIEGFPQEVVERMLYEATLQGNHIDVSVFEEDKYCGFTWVDTEDGGNFWNAVIVEKIFSRFFERYPKQTTYYLNTSTHKISTESGDFAIGGLPELIIFCEALSKTNAELEFKFRDLTNSL